MVMKGKNISPNCKVYYLFASKQIGGGKFNGAMKPPLVKVTRPTAGLFFALAAHGFAEEGSCAECGAFASGNLNFLLGTWVGPRPCSRFAHLEGAEAGQGHFVPRLQRVYNGLQRIVDDCGSLSLRNVRFLGNFGNQFALLHEKLLRKTRELRLALHSMHQETSESSTNF